MSYFPLMVEMKDKRILIIGAGTEAGKKVELMKRFGASVTVIAPDAEIDEAGEDGTVKADRYIKKCFEDSDITEGDYDIIIAATDDRELNSRISSIARRLKIPVNIVDDAELCEFIFPAVIKESEIVLAISSGGKSPYVVQYIKKLIQDVLPEEIGEINDKMGEYRIYAKEHFSDVGERRNFLKDKLGELIAEMI